jgi:hypothetical protein
MDVRIWLIEFSNVKPLGTSGNMGKDMVTPPFFIINSVCRVLFSCYRGDNKFVIRIFSQKKQTLLKKGGCVFVKQYYG